MGAGCYHTLHEDRDSRAYWVIVNDEDVDDYMISDTLDAVKQTLEELPLCRGFDPDNRRDMEAHYGDFFTIRLGFTHSGKGIVVDLEYREETGYDMQGFQRHMYLRCYHKIIKHLNKFFELGIATGGYTSATLAIGEVK